MKKVISIELNKKQRKQFKQIYDEAYKTDEKFALIAQPMIMNHIAFLMFGDAEMKMQLCLLDEKAFNRIHDIIKKVKP